MRQILCLAYNGSVGMNVTNLLSNEKFMHSLRMMFMRKRLDVDDGVQETFAIILSEEPDCIDECLKIGNKVASRMWRRRKREAKYRSLVDVMTIMDDRVI